MGLRYLAFLTVASVAIFACATGGKSEAAAPLPQDEPGRAATLPPLNPNEVYRPEVAANAKKPEARKSGRVTIEKSIETAGNVVRAIGTQAGGNIVLMNGVENRMLYDIELKRESVADSIAIVAAGSGLIVNDTPQYVFLIPEGYEQLLNLSLAGRIDQRYANITTDATFGSGLPLFTVFMWMGYALDISIVADNSVGEERCGELALQQVPVEIALEAILKSARVVALAADSTPEYIFFGTPANQNPASLLLDEASLTEQQRALLDKQVSLALPRPLRTGERMELPMHASKLGDILPALSEQLGVQVVAEKGLLSFPVNPIHLHKVRVRTAMDLLLRQWLEANYGYQVTKDRIVIRRK
ncbi:MAG TPA: hypothetical protein PLJ47_06100 [Candidatus Hydrogenedentes bacterium]|nr:hypothetical protein [Candidatus Hydrogenedentota bacterium]